MSQENFGEYIKALRLGQGITLRGFCLACDIEPSNYSKIERGLLPPPRELSRLETFRKALNLEASRPEWRELMRLAALDRGEIPRRILSDQEIVGKLPALFRTLEGDTVDENVLNELIAAIKREYNPQQ